MCIRLWNMFQDISDVQAADRLKHFQKSWK